MLIFSNFNILGQNAGYLENSLCCGVKCSWKLSSAINPIDYSLPMAICTEWKISKLKAKYWKVCKGNTESHTLTDKANPPHTMNGTY